MDRPIKILAADSSEDYLTLFASIAAGIPNVEVVAAVRSGEEVLRLMTALHPDVLVMDVILRGMDGVSVLRALREAEVFPRAFVVSAFYNDTVAAELGKLGVEFCYQKPCRLTELFERICCNADGKKKREIRPEQKGKDEQMAEAFYQFGILPKLRGYHYLWAAVERSLENGNALYGVTKTLYPDIARQFGTNARCVEHGMRNALKVAWERRSREDRDAYFGRYFMGVPRRPSNSEFIAGMATFIRMKMEDAEGNAV